MTALTWAAPGQSKYMYGVSKGVLFLRDEVGEYTEGVAFPGLTTVTESPSGAESNKQYADNRVYANLKSAEEFGATIEAFWYPKEFDRCNGLAEPVPGISIGQQNRETFGFSWRSEIGDDLNGSAGYKIHLAYGCDAAPTEVANTTVNDSPEAGALSWEVTTIPVEVGTYDTVEYKPTAHLVVDSTMTDPTALSDLLDILYGTNVDDPRLPLPAEVFELVGTGLTEVNMNVSTSKPTYVDATHIITLPAVTGVQWKINGVNKANGAQPALMVGQTADVTAHAQAGYNLVGDADDTFEY